MRASRTGQTILLLLAACHPEPSVDQGDAAVGIGVAKASRLEVQFVGQPSAEHAVRVATVEADPSDHCTASSLISLSGATANADLLLPRPLAVGAGALSTWSGDRNVLQWQTQGDHRYLMLGRLEVLAHDADSLKLGARETSMCQADSATALIEAVAANTCTPAGEVTLKITFASSLPDARCGVSERASAVTDLAGTALCHAGTPYVCTSGPPHTESGVDTD